MYLFKSSKEPVFLKESSNAQEQLEKLKALEPLLNSEGKALIKQNICYLEYGITGEEHIAFELKNSYFPMYILHDVYLEEGDLNAQIDYLVFTDKLCFVIECKNLYGNIEINNRGDFIRTMEFAGKKRTEGIYSPITQNQRHLELMKRIKNKSKKNILSKFMVDRYFEEFYKPVVVLANPKTVINARYANKDVKERVIRADQLVQYIKDAYEKSKETTTSHAKTLEWAQFYLNLHKEVWKNYTEKYEKYKLIYSSNVDINTDGKKNTNTTIEGIDPVEETDVFRELKDYRLNKSREEKLKPYFIYNDKQLKDLITKKPGNKQELQLVDGFGDKKIYKYGNDILDILKKY